MSDSLFTGERYMPGIEDENLEIEHYQRYLSVRKIVKGKTVLDAACGEGYGTSILASVAQNVIGIDIDAETIQRAQKKYENLTNASYMQGSIAELPLEDKSVDAIVSFETIEHVPEDIQKKFLVEIARVLKDDGFLVMSTPNKQIYSDLYNYHNEFHVKEFYHDEFVSFLHEAFQNVKLYNQVFDVVSLITTCEGKMEVLDCYGKKEHYKQDGKYYIAIASNCDVENLELDSVYIKESGEYERINQRVIELQRAEEERNQHIANLDGELVVARNIIKELQCAEEESNQHIANLDGELVVARNIIEELQRGEEERNTHIAKLDAEINEMINREKELSVTCEELRATEEYYRNELNNKNGHIELLLESERTLEREKSELERENKNKEGHIQLLLASERAYEGEKRSRTYRLAKKMQRIIQKLFPAESCRRFAIRVLIDMVRHPIKMFKVINPKLVVQYHRIRKTRGMEAVRMKYMEAKMTVFCSNTAEDSKTSQDIKENNQVLSSEATDIKEYEIIELPVHNKPQVSIIVPVYNQFHYTYDCIKSINVNSKDVSYEVIIANDCSTDITKEAEKIIKNVKLITTDKNVRFLLNCNNAAKYAKGKYILFLNNDTQVKENWLQPLVSLIESDDQIGMVGSKLLYPDGTLQEAGGIVWKDASAWNYGNRQSPEDPEYNYVKEADYISGAAIMIKRSLWNELGGFDEQFAPAYYEDTDLAFQVRKAGYKVMYQPLSEVVHFEGVSNGTDVQSGLKHYQQVNYEKFYEKWKDVLESEHEVNAENVFTAKDRSNHKKHILVVDHYVPHHDQDAGGKCTFMYLKTFVKMGLKVTFIGDNFYKHEPYTTELNQLGIEVLYGNYYYNNWENWLKDNLHYFDYVYLQRPHISVKYIDIVKEYSHAKVIYFAHDLHHIREYREYEMTKDPEKLKSSEKWKKIEYDLFSKTDVGHVVGSYEQEVMQKAFPSTPIRNIPLYIYESLPENINKDFSTRENIMYVGGFGHPPNIDAVLWFGKEVFPKILQKYPTMKWYVAGSKVTPEVQALDGDNIKILGFVSDEELENLYRTCRIAIVPLRVGAGVKGKVVESAYFQTPLVTTSIGAEGLDDAVGNMVVEDNNLKMAEIVCKLYEDYETLQKMSDAGGDFIQKYFTLNEAERVLRLDIDI